MSARAAATMVLSRKVTNSTRDNTASASRGRVVPCERPTTLATYPSGCPEPSMAATYTAARCQKGARPPAYVTALGRRGGRPATLRREGPNEPVVAAAVDAVHHGTRRD